MFPYLWKLKMTKPNQHLMKIASSHQGGLTHSLVRISNGRRPRESYLVTENTGYTITTNTKSPHIGGVEARDVCRFLQVWVPGLSSHPCLGERQRRVRAVRASKWSLCVLYTQSKRRFRCEVKLSLVCPTNTNPNLSSPLLPSLFTCYFPRYACQISVCSVRWFTLLIVTRYKVYNIYLVPGTWYIFCLIVARSHFQLQITNHKSGNSVIRKYFIVSWCACILYQGTWYLARNAARHALSGL